jgi:CHAT domain-containing protein
LIFDPAFDSESVWVSSFETDDFLAAPSLVSEHLPALQKGKQAYRQGRLATALQWLQREERSQYQQKNWLDAALTQSWMALTYQQLGNTKAAHHAIAEGFQLLERSPAGEAADRIQGQLFNVRGQMQLHGGNPQTALAAWQQATKCYQALGDVWGTAIARVKQAQALYALQKNLAAADLLAEVWHSSNQQPDSPFKIQLWYWMGKWWQQTGNLSQGKQALERALVVLRGSPFGLYRWQAAGESAILSSLGDLARRQQQLARADDLYQQAEQVAAAHQLPVLQIQAQLHRLRLVENQAQWQAAQRLAGKIAIPLQDLPATRRTLLLQLERVRLLACLQQRDPSYGCFVANPPSVSRSQPWLPWQEHSRRLYQQTQQAIAGAESLHDRQALSWAWGTMGWLQEREEYRELALASTQKALRLAAATKSDRLRYQWYWQKGRLLWQRDNRQGAVAAYSQALETLQTLRCCDGVTYARLQMDFRDRIEPVYRQLVALLLPQGELGSPSQLRQARRTIEQLQRLKMEHFFQDTQLQAGSPEIPPHSGVWHTIFLPQRLEVLLSLPDGSLHRHTVWVGEADAGDILQRLQNYLRQPDRTVDVQTLSQQIYGWLLAPFADRLGDIDTCVFVLDGALAGVPMSVLYDGEHYLLEKYAIARVPAVGMLADPTPSPTAKALIAGIDRSRTISDRYFVALDSVREEWQTIQSLLPHQLLVNTDLTYKKLKENLQKTPFSILHIATHGEFRSQMQDTFLLLWDQLMGIRDLERLLQVQQTEFDRVLDLLVLSACETARGDRQAPLGLAGMAIRAGARSTLATLWQVNDESTAALMSEFYRQYLTQPQMGKAQALRRAQLHLWESSQRDWAAPFFWAPYVLVGRWM